MGAREELAAVLHRSGSCQEASEEVCGHLADALLASPALARLLDEARREVLREAADELAAEARLLSSGPGDKIRRTTLNIAAKNLRRKVRGAP